jgi:hypothetical protein
VNFERVLQKVLWRLVTEGSISYRRIKLSFALDNDGLEELRSELIGIGKGHIWVAIRCSPFHTASAFHPIIEHLKRVFGWQLEDTAPQHLAKLEAGLAGFKTLPLAESVRLFADLMSVPAPEDRYPRLQMTAQQERNASSGVLETRDDAYVLRGALAQLHIPETLQDSLMARLDRAPRLREVAQLGSVLGCEFAYDMISALAGIEEEMLQSGLGRLVVDELLYQRGRPPRSRYLFKHALIQDAAYQSLLKRTRQQADLRRPQIASIADATSSRSEGRDALRRAEARPSPPIRFAVDAIEADREARLAISVCS